MKKIIENIFWLLFENGSRIVFALVLNAVLARSLGIDGFGQFQYVLSLVVMFSAISFICGAEVIVPILSNVTGKRVAFVIGNVFTLGLIFSILAYVFLIAFVFVFEQDKELFYLTIILGLSILVGESFAVVTAWLQANTNSKPRSILVIFTSFIKCGMVYFLYIYDVVEIKYYALAWAFESYFIAFGLFYIYKKKVKLQFFSFDKKYLLFFMKKGFPFFISLLIMYLFLRLDILALKYYSDFEQVGLYGAVFQLINAISLIAPIFAMSIAPSLVYKAGVSNVRKRVIYVALGLGSISVFIAIIMNSISDFIIPFIFGERFVNAVPIFNVFVWIIVLFFISEGLNIYIIKLGKGKLLTYKWLIILLVAILAYIYFIPKYQALGAVLGYGMGYASAIIFSFYVMFTRKLR